MHIMNKRKILAVAILVTTTLASTFGFYFYQIISSPNILVNRSDQYLDIPTGISYPDLLKKIQNENIVNDISSFAFLAKLMNYSKKVKPGRYLLQKDMNNVQVIRMLRAGEQTPVRITFNDVRTKENLAEKITSNIELTKDTFLELLKSDSIAEAYGFNSYTLVSLFIPNTYEVYWDISAIELLSRMKKEYHKFWNQDRLNKAEELGLAPTEVSTLASIVHAEQLVHTEERPTIAGLYINRLQKNYHLASDPTLVFGIGDFKIKRVLNKHKTVDSPYNTYKYPGLPPGPIYLPSISSIDAVLNYERHKYLYMCAKADFSGYHAFAKDAAQHRINANEYHQALNKARVFK